ncbi:MAG TPA: hypothetical protein PLI43_05005 [Albidovulum sp.]|uniref:hypothetical protein n=1 Tax=Albidovulum sp. TaxID=1872424 RepID=UPI002C37B9CD|nr:hypothetical protein [Albidovulum sp.]
MARRNRVTPEGRIIADPARGMFMGNRGILCGSDGALRKPYQHRAWICCVLDWKGNRQPLASAHRWTPLFFLDEAVALAAGHRPCATCRRDAYNRFRAAWAAATGTLRSAKEMDAAHHPARILPRQRTQVTHKAGIGGLPDGTFIGWNDTPTLILGDRLLPWSPSGYDPALPRPASGVVTVLTPAPTVAVLAAGYRPVLHETAL